MTQHEALKSWFKKRKTITTREAVEKLGILSLHKRIAELELRGWCFVRPSKKVPSRYEGSRPITVYTVVKAI